MTTLDFYQTAEDKGFGFWEAESDHSTLRFSKQDTGRINVTLITKETSIAIHWVLEPASWVEIAERMK